jgi:Mg2+ and Co2+ transporter CorA
MDLSTEEILSLLSERARAEISRSTEYRFILQQIQYLTETVREGFEDFADQITELEEMILSSDYRQASLKRQLATHYKNLNTLQEEKAKRGGEINISLDNRIETLQEEIEKIQKELKFREDVEKSLE